MNQIDQPLRIESDLVRFTLVVCLILLGHMVHSQDYVPIHGSTGLVYRSGNKIHSLKVDSLESTDIGLRYHLSKNISDIQDQSGECNNFWAGGCYLMTHPSIFGADIFMNNDQSWLFSSNGDTFRFCFLNSFDSLIAFSNSNFSIYSYFEGESTEMILGQLDSVRTYQLRQFDLNENIIQSPITGYNIKMTKSHGLSTFFRIDTAYSTFIPIDLIGNSESEAGLYEINETDFYDFEIGDVIQYKIVDGVMLWALNVTTDYITYQIINKTLYLDTLRYTIRRETFSTDLTGLQIDTITTKHPIFNVISIPFESFDGWAHDVYYKEICGQPLLAHTQKKAYMEQCETVNCFGGYDTNGPPRTVLDTKIFGLGLYGLVDEDMYYGNAFVGSTSHKVDLVYFQKGDVSCGAQQIVSANDGNGLASFKHAHPNPSYGVVRLENVGESQVFIHNSLGDVIEVIDNKTSSLMLDMSKHGSGIFFLRIEGPKSLRFERIIVY